MACWQELQAQDATVREPSQIIEVDRKAGDEKPPVITAVAILPGGGQVATAGDDHVVRIWSATNGRIVHTLKGHADWVRSLAFSPDGQILASAGDDRQIMLWNVSSGKRTLVLPRHSNAIYSLAFSPDGQSLAAVGFENKVCLYDWHAGKKTKDLIGPDNDLRSVVFSPNGRQLAVGGRNGQMRVWAMPGGSSQFDLSAGQRRLRTLAYVPSSEKLLAAGDGREISVWDTATGQELHKFNCPAGRVLSMSVCSDSLIATGGSDNLVRIWNWQSQAEIDRLLGHTGSVAALAFDRESNVIISGSFDTTVRVWKLNPTGGGRDTTAGAAATRAR
jgi:WD40 repeat protein